MKVDTHIVDSFLAMENIDKFKNYWIYKTIGQGEFKYKNVFSKPSSAAMEDIQMIYNEIKQCLLDFEPFNRELWDILFPNWVSLLQNVEIYLIVGLPEPNDATVIKNPSGTNVIVLDLGCWAKYLRNTNITQLVRNIITHEFCHICIQGENPAIDRDYENGDYLTKFNSLVFNEGLAHLLSFCENINNYDWNNPKISEVKSKSLLRFKEAIVESETEKQNSYLYDAMFGNYYDKFGCIIGMLYFSDIYQKYKSQGLLDEYTAGHKDIIKKILNFYR